MARRAKSVNARNDRKKRRNERILSKSLFSSSNDPEEINGACSSDAPMPRDCAVENISDSERPETPATIYHVADIPRCTFVGDAPTEHVECTSDVCPVTQLLNTEDGYTCAKASAKARSRELFGTVCDGCTLSDHGLIGSNSNGRSTLQSNDGGTWHSLASEYVHTSVDSRATANCVCHCGPRQPESDNTVHLRRRTAVPEQTESEENSTSSAKESAEERSTKSDDEGGSDSESCESDCSASTESEGEECQSDCDLSPTQDAAEDGSKHHWNTPEGWAKVRTGIDEFMREMARPGHTCAICGERKVKCKKITRQMLQTWCIVVEPEELDDALYTQYPKKSHSPNQSEFRVCPRCIAEGRKRFVKDNDPDKIREKVQTPMRYSKLNTGIRFEYADENHPLQGLNLVEESLISLISVVVIIRTVEGGQSMTTGNSSLFVNWDGVGQVAEKLPRRLDQARVKIAYPNMNQTLAGRTPVNLLGYMVNPTKIRLALGYLKRYNPLYAHVEFDEEAMNQIEEDFERYQRDNPIVDPDIQLTLSQALDPYYDEDMRYSMHMDSGAISPDIVPELLAEMYAGRPVPASGSSQATQPNTGQVPTVTIQRNGQPCRAHEVPNLLGQAFPTLFPKGAGCDYREYKTPLTTAQMLKHVMKLSDPRFSQHYRFLFFMVNMKSLETAYKSVSAVLKGGVVRRDPEGAFVDITEETLDNFAKENFRNSEELERLIRRKHIIFNCLRGTAAYWEKQKLQIKHMIALKGTPTAFLTFSSADLYWKDMQAYLKTYYTDEEFQRKFQIDRDDFMVNRRLLNQNQVLAADFFVRRLKMFLRHVATRKDVLGGTVTDYVIRYETQGRGSVHAHILLWIDIDKEYIRDDDWISLDTEVLQKYGLVKENEVTRAQEELFDKVLLAYMNANIWALRDVGTISRKLNVLEPSELPITQGYEDPDGEDLFGGCHASEIVCTEVPDELLADRLAQASAEVQTHECFAKSCLKRRVTNAVLRQANLDPKTLDPARLTPAQLKELYKCKKRFPRDGAPEDMGGDLAAYARVDQVGNVTYHPCRDNGYTNNYHPIFLHVWGANTDMQILHKPTGSEINVIAAYITSYISKMDKTQNVSWRDVLRQLDREMHDTAMDDDVEDVDRALHKDIYDTVKKIVADREMTAQEAALDALQLPLIQFSTSVVYVQANRPDDTYVLPRKRKDRAKRRRIDEQHRHLVYDPPVTKYVLRPTNAELIADDSPLKGVDMDNMCMYEYFSEYRCEQDPETLNYRIKKRKKPVVVVPTPYIKPSLDNERWCYQALMLFTPFRHHKDVMRHPAFRFLTDRMTPMHYIDPDLSVGLPPTQPSTADAQSVEVQAMDDEEFQPVDVWNMTEAEAQRMFDVEFATPQPDPDELYDGMYDKATALLQSIVGRIEEGWWPEKYANCHSVLSAINDHLMEGYIESQTEPDQADLLNALAQMGVDLDGPICVEEMLHAIREQRAVAQDRLRTDPASCCYVSTALNEAVQNHCTIPKGGAAPTCVPASVDPYPELRTATKPELVEIAEREYDDIKQRRQRYATCTLRQRVFLLTMMEAVIDVIKVDNQIPCPRPHTCRLILQGEAGTGKSYVLKMAVELCCKYLEPKAVKVFAPTAFAAKVYEDCACGSSTLASVWKKGYTPGVQTQKKSKVAAMPSDAALALKQEMDPVRALICDEMSMLSPNDLAMMHNRLRQISDKARKGRLLFRDMPIMILAGDMYQLPPVLASPLYVERVEIDPEKGNKDYYDEVNFGLRLYHSFFDKAVVLNENKRQAGDPEWRKILQRVRNGEATRDDQQRLMQYTLEESELVPNPDLPADADPAYIWQRCPRYFPRKDDIMNENFQILCHEFPNPEDRFDASSINKIGKTRITPENLATFGPKFYKQGPSLILAVGAKVMVTENLDAPRQWGIINGTIGTVQGYLSTDRGHTITHVLFRPDFVMRNMPPFKFTIPDPSTDGGVLNVSLAGTWPLPRSKTSMSVKHGTDKSRQLTVTCEKFPLTLAYALTIHKAQGITTPHAIVDISNCHEGQMAYVGMSRVETLDGIRFRRLPTLRDLNKFSRCKNKPLLEAEFSRIGGLQGALIEHLGLQEEDERVREILM